MLRKVEMFELHPKTVVHTYKLLFMFGHTSNHFNQISNKIYYNKYFKFQTLN